MSEPRCGELWVVVGLSLLYLAAVLGIATLLFLWLRA